MAKPRSQSRTKAYELWIDSGKTRALKDIAAELGVSDGLVRKWKNLDQWDASDKGTLPKKKKGNVTKQKRARGGQPGNKNAEGHGAPLGNKNNFKHGLYEEVFWDTLTAQELDMIQAMPYEDEEIMLFHEIQLLTARERRLMQRIFEQQEKAGGLALESVTKRKLETTGNIINDDNQTQDEITTRTISTFEVIAKLEAELTRVQGKKTRCLEALNKLRVERRKLDEESKGNAAVNDWVSALMRHQQKKDGDADE